MKDIEVTRYELTFANSSGAELVVNVDLTQAELTYVGKVRANGGRDPGSGVPTDPDIVAMALALQFAYRSGMVPSGFRHIAPPRRMFLQ